MATNWLAGAGWKLVDERSVPETRMVTYGTATAVIRRAVDAKVYSRPMENASTIPDSPVNPGNLEEPPSGATSLSGYWFCKERGASSSYGDAGAKMYSETWERKGDWEAYA